MILDYYYNQKFRKLSVSYINKDAQKSIMDFNVNRFKTYYFTPSGKYTSEFGAKCDVRWTEKPHKFDVRTYLNELPEQQRSLLNQRIFPKVYTFDIETEISDEFPNPALAEHPITAISIASPNLNTIVLGTRPMTEAEQQSCSDRFDEYLDKTEFYHTLTFSQKPTFKYVYFKTEEEMINHFLTNIVSKVAVLTGWNCILFDWQYIVNRVHNYYPNLSISSSSCKRSTHFKSYTDMKGTKIQLPMPDHTLILDMKQVIEDEDKVVLPIKESMSLDYIASASLNIHKIKYKGSLQDLFDNDFPTYVHYNAIDSILVQLINKHFKTLDHIYLASLKCVERIGDCFSKIACAEALFWNYFVSAGYKIVPTEHNDVERGALTGAYVKVPITGLHEYVCCNDFASLYPSTIRTCNLSVENFVGHFYKEDVLDKYRNALECGKPKYKIVCANVYEAKSGKWIGNFVDDEALDKYRKDPNFFVSINGHVYRNDRDYAFKCIQTNLKNDRNNSKYMAKRLNATVMLDIEHILKNTKIDKRDYNADDVNYMKKMGYTINSSDDLSLLPDIKEFKRILASEITYLENDEQSTKILMNSLYGGSSHPSFYWTNIYLANDVTGESKNLTHLMEHHIADFWRHNWLKMTDLHDQLGIKVNEKQAMKALENAPIVTEQQDPDAYHERSWVYAAYGDTDSLYLSYKYLLDTIEGVENMTKRDKLNVLVQLNTKFLDKHNKEFIAEYYKGRHAVSVHDFELETVAQSGVWLDVKKRYAQILLWKDGKFFDDDDLPMKIKGLEMIKASVPTQARSSLKYLTRFLLENAGDKYLAQKINMQMQQEKQKFLQAPIEDCCGNMGVNGYQKYVISDDDRLVFRPKCPSNVKALANYNHIRNKYHLSGDPIYTGKMKWYIFGNDDRFAFRSMDYPEWADKYAPINKRAMFNLFVIDPFNRIIEGVGLPLLNIDGSIQISLF